MALAPGGLTLRQVLFGSPASDDHQPEREDWLRYGEGLEELVAENSGGKWVSFSTKSAMDSTLSYPADTEGRVYDDGANNGIYKKTGASGSGSWDYVGPIPEGDTTEIEQQLAAIGASRGNVDADLDLVGVAGYRSINYFGSEADTLPRQRIVITDSGIDFYAGGDGATIAAAFVMRVRASDKTVVAAGHILADNGQPVWGPHNQPAFLRNSVTGTSAARIASGPRVPFRNIADTQPRTIDEPSPIFIPGTDIGKIVNVTGNRRLDLSGFPSGGSVEIITGSVASSAEIFGGESANWRGRTSGDHTITLDADTHVTIYKVSASDFLCTVHRGAITSSTANKPAARDTTVVVMGESHAQYFGSYGGFTGVQDRFRDLSLSPSIYGVNCGFGGAAIMENFGTSADNYFWTNIGSPGPRAVTSLERIQSAISDGQPAPSDVLLIIGENELDNLTTTTLVEAWISAAKALIGWFRSELSLPNLRFHWVPLGARDFNNYGDARHTAVREAQLAVVGDDPNVLHGPEMYDLSREYGDTHLDFRGLYTMGRRWADHLDNVMNGASNDLGPEIIGFTEINETTFRVEINAGGAGAVLPPLSDWPQGFALLNPGSAIGQTSKGIKRFSWTFSGGTYKLTIVTTAPASGARLAYPWGTLSDIRSDYVRDALLTFRPLRTYVG